MSPLMQQRFHRFRQNKLGFGCFIVFLIIFILSLCAEFIANDRPLLVRYQQSLYFPILKDYPETTFGGQFETATDYQDPAVKQLIQQQGWMLSPPVAFSYQSPNLSLAIYGLRISLLFGLALTVCSAVIGIMVGAVQGYYGGWIDLIGQRILEVWGGLPMLFIVMILVSMFSPSVYWLFLIMLLFGWTELVGLVRAEFLRARNFDYVRAAQALGVSDSQIIFKHILPNAMSSSLSQIPFMLTANIIALTALDFLGYGLPPDAASLGELLLQGKNNLEAPWLVLSGFFTLAIVLSLLIYIGEAARDAFDPRR